MAPRENKSNNYAKFWKDKPVSPGTYYGLTMVPRENKSNTYAKFWRDKQRVLSEVIYEMFHILNCGF